MTYKDMVLNARHNGIADEQAMYKSIENVDKLLATLKEHHPKEYMNFMRKTHEDLYGSHYDQMFAEHDVSNMRSTNIDGKELKGAFWSVDELKLAFQGKEFPSGTTDWDIYVAANAIYHDLSKEFSDSDILKATYLFFFDDEDAPDGKVWKYICAMMY